MNIVKKFAFMASLISLHCISSTHIRNAESDMRSMINAGTKSSYTAIKIFFPLALANIAIVAKKPHNQVLQLLSHRFTSSFGRFGNPTKVAALGFMVGIALERARQGKTASIDEIINLQRDF